jgi:hypothetical protein
MKKRAPRRDVFTYTPLLRGIALVGLVLGVAGFASEVLKPPEERSPLVVMAFAAFAGFCGLALAQGVRGRIELREDEIRVVELFGHKSYPRSEVVAAKWEKGCPVSLRLRDDSWARLPDMGHPSTKVAGAIRAWLNDGSRG